MRVADIPDCVLARKLRISFLLHCLSAVGLLLLAVGCGDSDHGDRIPISGTVTVQGEPLDVNATIYFNPQQQESIGSSAEVADSKFEVSAETGPTPGQKYDVTLTTTPGIPAEGTSLEDAKLPQTYKTVVDVPQRGDEPVVLEIDFNAQG